MKKYFEFKTRTIVATAIGAAIFTLLFMFVKIPSPVPETSFQVAYGISAFFGALFGPIASLLIAFIGHFLSDTLQYGSAWMSWVIASGIASFVFGFFYKTSNIDEGELKGKDLVRFNILQIVGNAIAWILIAPVLDIIIYSEPANLVFTQGAVAFLMNTVSTGVLGSLLLIAYSKTRTGKGTLSKQD
ncbi:MAG: ECF transporter S component [Spirochaetales bacterium]|nr:MAG: ECF transporter S component [Spirochaetales bacterium]